MNLGPVRVGTLTGPKFIFIAMLLAAAFSSCKSTKSLTTQKKVPFESGVASWYGPGFQGKKTANGEKFNTYGFTAAHRTLPFNTELRVTNLANGKSVKVRINDRGPYAKDRIIDLSKAAASKLDMINQGTARVELFLLNTTSDKINIENIKKPTYTIQVASFSEKSNAMQKASTVAGAWVKEVRTNKGKVYRVFVGKFADTAAASRKNNQLKSQGIKGFVKQIEN